SAQIKALGAQALGKRVPQLVIKTNEGNMLDPGQPGTADYVASICEEIVRGFDIDGLNFDYLRYPEKEISFSDGATYRRYASAGQSLADWRRENINRLVETIHRRVKAIKPWVALSCSPVGKYADTHRYPAGGWNALNAVSQDAKLWLREGWMDILMPMQYFRGRHYYPFLLDWQEDAAGRTIASGLGVYQIDRQQQNWPLSEMESQISYCRRYGVGGQVFFRSRFVTDNTKGIYNLLRYNLYRTQALPPAIDSKRSAPPAPVNARIEETPNGYTLKWEAAEACRYVLYRSSTYPVDTEDANNIYKVGLTEPQFTISLPLLEGWLPYYAVTAIDRYGHESAPLEINKERKMRTFAPLEINKEKKISTLKR
ncbi:MAG: family 10 glycosylhydrolase, partial [Bacteroidaceae bacterium]|nr:family 10 glycosylhydrolase [Bacteroidaceae bacterium]